MGHKILLADDSITIQKVIELTFSDEDFELHTVGNGQKAIDEIRSIMPHIVLCDIIMPEKNGYEVCEFIKSSADLKHIPVLLLTGAFEPFDQERARTAGCDGFLAKPFEPQTLISKVKELLVRTPSVAAAPAAAPPPASPKPFPAPPSPRMEADDRTVVMPATSGGVAPVRPPHVAAAPPPPAPHAEYGSGFDDAFAIEAGERELMMEPGDHTVLLGGREGRSAAPAAGDDIWGAVEAAPTVSEEEDSSTVFMAPPPPAASPPAPVQAFTSQDYEVQYEANDLDATWRMPNEGAVDAGPPPYQGFEEFTDPPLQEAASYVPPPPVTGTASDRSRASAARDASATRAARSGARVRALRSFRRRGATLRGGIRADLPLRQRSDSGLRRDRDRRHVRPDRRGRIRRLRGTRDRRSSGSPGVPDARARARFRDQRRPRALRRDRLSGSGGGRRTFVPREARRFGG